MTLRARRPGPSVRTRVVEYAGDARREHEHDDDHDACDGQEARAEG
jgi:hypothetical protein